MSEWGMEMTEDRATQFVEKHFSIAINIIRANADLFGSAWADSAECELENTRDEATENIRKVFLDLEDIIHKVKLVDPEDQVRAALIRSAVETRKATK